MDRVHEDRGQELLVLAVKEEAALGDAGALRMHVEREVEDKNDLTSNIGYPGEEGGETGNLGAGRPVTNLCHLAHGNGKGGTAGLETNQELF